jgi:RNA-directed DNA polymerase
MSKARNEKPMMEWKDLPWRKLERKVFKLQTRIFKASQNGDERSVRRLQKTLMRSWSAKCLAVRRVTQDNQGKNTAGVDGIKSLSPKQRIKLVNRLSLSQKAKPTRRVWIPKPGSDEKRPLGIPTMDDRALQALAKHGLEPEWEAKFEPNSYGFRPGRSAHDAIAAIFQSVCHKPKYVLDADITKCFDRINHTALLKKLNTYPTLRRTIKGWLKSRVVDGGTLFPTNEGTPQGGVISPLLANIALHGMEQWIKQDFMVKRVLIDGKNVNHNPVLFVRYADDFVLMHESIEVVQACQERITQWLANLDLTLKASKTKITHTLNEHEGNLGFDFLGFKVRQFPSAKSKVNANLKRKAFKTLIKPTKEGIMRHYNRVAQVIDANKSNSQTALINELNPIIRGWANYYSRVASKECFSRIGNLIYKKLKTWAKRRHPNKSGYWVAAKYWHIEKGKGWSFADLKKNSVVRVMQHADIPIRRHVKVIQNRSPYDRDWVYWSTRMGRSPEISNRMAALLKRQKGKCQHCSLFFKHNDAIEIDLIIQK